MKDYLLLTLSLFVASVLFAISFFELSGSSLSISLFNQLDMEPYGRILSGIGNFVIGVLILIPRTQTLGAFMEALFSLGTIICHLLILGVVVENDGGSLFALVCILFLSCLIIMYLRRNQIKKGIQKSVSFL